MNFLNDAREWMKQFFTSGLWQIRMSNEPKWRRGGLRQLQLWALVGREFIADRCLLQAAALAFTTLLSIVPLLALMFAVLKGFEVQKRLQPLLLEYLAAGSESVITAIFTYINNTNVTGLGAVGLVALILAVLSLISGVEDSFNAIWGVKETRSVSRRFASYFSIVTLGPALVVAVISMTGSLKNQMVMRWLFDMALVGTLLTVMFKILPFVVMWMVFAGLYLFIPNARVSPRAALVGGVFGGTLWQLSQWAYVDFQVGVVRYNTIYGTLAALPIFMVWLFLAWAIVLLGLEVAFAVQNLPSVRRDLRGGRVSTSGRTRIALSVLLHLARRFQRGEPAPSAESMAEELEIPPRLLRTVLALLQRLELVAEIDGGNGTSAYLPAREPDTIRLAGLLAGIADDGTGYLPPKRCAEYAVIARLTGQLAAASDGVLGGVTLRNLVEEAESNGREKLQTDGEL